MGSRGLIARVAGTAPSPTTPSQLVAQTVRRLATPLRLLGLASPSLLALALSATAASSADAGTLWLGVAWLCVQVVPSGLAPREAHETHTPSAHLPVPHRVWLADIAVRHALAAVVLAATGAVWSARLGVSAALLASVGGFVLLTHAMLQLTQLREALPNLGRGGAAPLVAAGLFGTLASGAAFILGVDGQLALMATTLATGVVISATAMAAFARPRVGT